MEPRLVAMGDLDNDEMYEFAEQQEDMNRKVKNGFKIVQKESSLNRVEADEINLDKILVGRAYPDAHMKSRKLGNFS